MKKFFISKEKKSFVESATGLNFINVIQTAFACADPECAKRLTMFLSFLALSGSAHVKAAYRMLMKLMSSCNSFEESILSLLLKTYKYKTNYGIQLIIKFISTQAIPTSAFPIYRIMEFKVARIICLQKIYF
jgi:hypothetical protein